MNKESILEYISTTIFPGQDLYTLEVYGPNAMPCWFPCKEFSTNATTDTDNNKIVFDKTQPRTGEQIDETKVAVRTIMLRYAENKCDTDVALRMNYIHPAFAETEKQFNDMITAAGGIGGAFAIIPKNSSGGLTCYSLKYDGKSLYLNPAFIKTLMHITEDNILNGVQTIPPEVCEKAQLEKNVTVYTVGGGKTKREAECYYVVPPDHVLAWTLEMTQFQRTKHGNYALELHVKDRLLYYLVPDWCFMKLYNDFCINWLGKVHLISMHDLAVEFIPRKQVPLQKVSVQFAFSFTGSVIVPKEVSDNMAPVTHTDFPLFRQTVAIKTEEEDYAKMIAEQEKKSKEERKL